jgi:hypothetical protein
MVLSITEEAEGNYREYKPSTLFQRIYPGEFPY